MVRILITLFWLLAGAPLAFAQGQVVMLRGQYGMFSWGLDELAKTLRQDGHVVRVRGHETHAREAALLAGAHRAGRLGRPLVLIGHSLGGNNVIAMARALAEDGIGVDLMVVLDATQPAPVPPNVVRAANYFIAAEGWGKRLVPTAGFSGRLDNADLSTNRTDLQDGSTQHTTMTRNPMLQRELLAAIRSLPAGKPVQAPAQTPARVPAR